MPNLKKITILSVVAATILLVGCGEDSKKTASDATVKAVETTKEAANHAVEATKKAADKAVEVAKEATAKAVEATKEAAEATKEATEKAVESAKAEKSTDIEGAKVYAKCSGCHGADGKTKALGKSPVIAGQNKAELITNLKAYKDGTRNENGMGNLMKGQMATLDDAMITEVATYISTLK